jgi:high-affinity Fe2+/Pb2+ permease
LFDASILGKFAGLIVPPLIVLIISSLAISDNFMISSIIIGIVSGILVLGIFVLYKKIDKKWVGEGFVV